MAKITLSGQGAVTVNDELFQMRSRWVADVSNVSEQTRDINATYLTLIQGGFVFIAIANLGTEDAVLRILCRTDYLRINIPAGGHVLLPGAGYVGSLDGEFLNPSIRTIANTSRIKLIIGTA